MPYFLQDFHKKSDLLPGSETALYLHSPRNLLLRLSYSLSLYLLSLPSTYAIPHYPYTMEWYLDLQDVFYLDSIQWSMLGQSAKGSRYVFYDTANKVNMPSWFIDIISICMHVYMNREQTSYIYTFSVL